ISSVILSFIIGATLGSILFSYLSPTGFDFLNYKILFDFLPLAFFAFFAGGFYSRLIRESLSLNQMTASTKEREKCLQSLAGSIAYEMRNPLGQIKHSLDTIGHNLPIPSTASATQIIPSRNLQELYQHHSHGRLAVIRGLQVISMILNEMQSGSLAGLKFTYLSAAGSTKKAIAEYGYETEGERGKIDLNIMQDFTFRGDETSYLFILFNLIKNALHFFKKYPNARIIITVNSPHIYVRDTGPGIPQSTLPYLFDVFYSADKSSGGTSLGLAYCQRMMRAFNGSISCHSVLGEYTEFTLQFPLVPQAELEHKRQEILNQALPVFSDKRILLVDDDGLARIAVKKILQKLGVTIDEAADGAKALGMLHQDSYDLIIMDLNMPKLDGYACTEKIRNGAAPGHQFVPIVAYTTEPAYMAEVKTQKVGMNGFLSKPCNELELIQTLRQAIKQYPRFPHTGGKNALLIGKTVLVAADEDAKRRIIRAYLREWGIIPLEAEHGIAVMRQLRSNPECSLVLMDMLMPDMDGLKTTRAIRASDTQFQNIKIITVSDKADESRHEIFASGATDYLLKPIDPTALHAKLLQHLTGVPCSESDSSIPSSHRLQGIDSIESEAATPTESPLFDFAQLEYITQTGVLKDALPSLRLQWSDWLDVLTLSVNNHDLAHLKNALHYFKGSSSTVGSHAFYSYIIKISNQTLGDKWPTEENWLANFIYLHGRTVEGLAKHLEEYDHFATTPAHA
ncbi:response regulator, partial [Herbaspirillum sp. RTI4]